MEAAIPRTTDCPTTESFTSEVCSLQGVDGLAKTKANSFSVTLENLELWPVGDVVHALGTPQDWFLKLKDGQRLHLPVEIEKSVHKEISEDHLLNWYDSCEATSYGDQEEYGTVTLMGSEIQDMVDLVGVEVAGTTLDGEMEPISVNPLAMAPPQLDGGIL